MKNLLEIGVAVHHGQASSTAFHEVSKQAVHRSLGYVNHQKMPVRCAVLLATVDWCTTPENLPLAFRSTFERVLGYKVPLIGGSVAAAYCSTEEQPIIENGFVLLAFCSDDLSVAVGYVDEPFSMAKDARRGRLIELQESLRKGSNLRFSSNSEKSLIGFLPGILPDKQHRSQYLDQELHTEILEAFKFNYPLFGASSASHLEPSMGYQFANDTCLRSGLALAIMETDLSTGAMLSHGLRPVADHEVSVDRLAGDKPSGYEVEVLDGLPAAEAMKKLKSQHRGTLEGPVLGLPYYPDYDIVWSVQPIAEYPASVRFKRKLHRGDRLRLLEVSGDEAVKAGVHALEGALSRSGVKVGNLSLILCFCCLGRLADRTERDHWSSLLSQLRDGYFGIPLVGGLTAGEFGVDEWRRPRGNNMSITVACLANHHTRAGEYYRIQTELLHAANRLATCRSSIKVMDLALEGAVRSGATGGQLCVVDYSLGKILGSGFGRSLRPAHSSQDWPLVSRMTRCKAPATWRVRLPSNLRGWAFPMVSESAAGVEYGANVPKQGNGSDQPAEHLLTLIAGTRHAVFVADSRDELFQCEQSEVREGNLRCQVALPLVGSQGKTIATLQIGLPDGTRMDRATFALWVGYAQSVAAVLERSYQAEDRDALREISCATAEVMLTSSDNMASSNDWCEEYLTMVKRLVHSQGAHMRVRERTAGHETDRLVAAIGPLVEVLAKDREVEEKQSGFWNDQVGQVSPVVLHTPAEIEKFYKGTSTLDDSTSQGALFVENLKKVESVAIFPFGDCRDNQGKLVVYSAEPNFVTDRRKYIASAAANAAGAIMRAQSNAFERARLDRNMAWMLDTLITATEGTVERRLVWLLERVCTVIEADLAGLFVWNQEARQLIAHTCHNWYKPMEGVATYAAGEGWTGSLVLDQGPEITFAYPGSESRKLCSRKYHEQMFTPAQRERLKEPAARIGIRLSAGGQLLGILTLFYYKDHTERMVAGSTTIQGFLSAVSKLVTLGLEIAIRETRRRLMRVLVETRNTVAEVLIQATASNVGWQTIVDTIRKGFNVERVTLYQVDSEKRVEPIWRSSLLPEGIPVSSQRPREPFGPLADVVRNGHDISIVSPDDSTLKLWPNSDGLRSLFATPLLTTTNEICGVLEFGNRIQEKDHPFSYFDPIEKEIARDLAQLLGAAMGQRENEQAMRRLRSELATATKIAASGLFGAIVMHQIMAPFSRMRGAIDWLLNHTDSDAASRARHLERIEVAYSQAVAAIHDASQREAPVPRCVSVRSIVKQAVRAIQPEVPKGVEVVVVDDSPARVTVDLWSVVGALVNLLSNGLEAINGKGCLTITAETLTARKKVSIAIHNTGEGLNGAAMRNAFRPGFSTKFHEGNLGLGLSLAKQAVEAAAGTIEMTSPESGGVEVRVELPLSGLEEHDAEEIRG